MIRLLGFQDHGPVTEQKNAGLPYQLQLYEGKGVPGG